ncbi:hypothetical protein Q9189_004003 [Teloschistes chrysophthalmus]
MGGQGMHRITFNDEGGWAFTLIAEKSTCMSTEIWSTITKNVGNLAPLQVDPKTARVGSKEELLKSPVADSEAEDDTALNHASPMSYTSSNTSSFHDHAFESSMTSTPADPNMYTILRRLVPDYSQCFRFPCLGPCTTGRQAGGRTRLSHETDPSPQGQNIHCPLPRRHGMGPNPKTLFCLPLLLTRA